MPDKTFSATIPASGNAVVTITSRPEHWSVSQVSVKGSTAPAGSICQLKKNGSFVTPIIATGGVATTPPDVELWPNDVMTVEFTAMTPGVTFEVYIIYTKLPP